MATKSQADKDSAGVCEKIYNAVAGNPAFRAIHRKSGRSQRPAVVHVTDSNQLALQNADKPGITLVSVPPKETVAQRKTAGSTYVNIQIHSEPPMMAKKEGIIAKPPAAPTLKSGGIRTISTGKDDAAKSTTAFLHIEGPEDINVAPKQQSGQLKKDASNNGYKPEAKVNQERDVSPNIVVFRGRGDQGTYKVSPEAEPAKRTPQIQKKTASKKNDHPDQSKKGGGEPFSEYINNVKNKLKSLSNIGDHNNEGARPTTRSVTRRDSFNDRVANYLNRASNHIKTTSNGVVGDK